MMRHSMARYSMIQLRYDKIRYSFIVIVYTDIYFASNFESSQKRSY